MEGTHLDKAAAFGRVLIETVDLDPVYVAVYEAGLKQAEKKRLVLAYSCLYHLGAAALIATRQGNDFWDFLENAARNARHDWPRGTERRHWRGQAAMKSAAWLRSRYKHPEQAVEDWSQPTFSAVAAKVQTAPLFGPWIAFKIADLLERVVGVPVSFEDCLLGVYRDPRMGAALLWTSDQNAEITDAELGDTVKALRKALGRKQAPPRFDRLINVQEVETVLCKYKSHINGHYPLGKDTKEVRHALHQAEWGRIGQKLAKAIQPHYERWGK